MWKTPAVPFGTAGVLCPVEMPRFLSGGDSLWHIIYSSSFWKSRRYFPLPSTA